MKLCATLILLVTALAASAEDLIQPDVAAALKIPQGWTQHTERITTSIYPPDNLSEGKPQRRIHITLSRYQAGTLEDAMNAELDAIAERAPEWGSWNDRNHLLGTHAVVTSSGVEGLAAEFGWKIAGKKKFSINKFYFRDESGKIFVVCAHAYAEEETGAEFEKIVRDRLTLRKADKAEPADPSNHSPCVRPAADAPVAPRSDGR